MSVVLAANGLVPTYHPNGLARETTRFDATFWTGSSATKFYDFATGAGGFAYKGTPLGLNASGQVTVAAAAGGATTSTATQIMGVFVGAEYTDQQGRRAVSTWFNDNLIATNQDPNVWFWLLTDPQIIYEIATTGTVANGAVGDEFNFSTTSPNRPQDGTVVPGGVGYSTTALSNAPVAAGVQGQVRCVGLGRGQGAGLNNWGDAFTTLQVQIANTSQLAPKGGL